MMKGILVLFLVSASKAEIAPVNEDDPEVFYEWTTPNAHSFYYRYTAGNTLVGNLFSGRSEFPWVVDIRTIDLESDKWSTGNLITLSHVLTTARSLEFIVNIHRFEHEAFIAEEDEGMLLSLENIGVDISFCANYLYEEYEFHLNEDKLNDDFEVFDNDVQDTGTRYARFMYKHPLYKAEDLSYDIGVIKLSYPIRPLPPIVDHMPIWYDNQRMEVSNVDLSHQIEQRRVCYIASYGRPWSNLQSSMVQDYKVKYRVYVAKMSRCTDRLREMRMNLINGKLHSVTFSLKPGSDVDQLMCFQMRARVGNVCDKDRGSPLVCDGRVYGFVARGAQWDECSDLLTFPFFVQKGGFLNRYYESIISHVFVPRFKPKSGSARLDSACRCLVYFSFLLTLSRLTISSYFHQTA